MSHVEVALFRFVRPLIAVVVTLVVGVIGYVAIEGWSVSDALYMVVTTMPTVGYREVRPLSAAGRAFTVVPIIVGVASLYYLFGASRGVRKSSKASLPVPTPLPDEDDDVIDDPLGEVPDQIDLNRLRALIPHNQEAGDELPDNPRRKLGHCPRGQAAPPTASSSQRASQHVVARRGLHSALGYLIPVAFEERGPLMPIAT